MTTGLLERGCGVLVICGGLLWVAGCAQGYEGVEATRQGASTRAAPRGGGSGVGGTHAAGSGGASAGSDAPSTSPIGVGEPCVQGDSTICTCTDKGTMGQTDCLFDASSPLDGYFSDCRHCPDPPKPASTPGDVTAPQGGSGGTGTGGMGGSGGSAAPAGSGGSPATNPPPPRQPTTTSCSSPCNQPCVPFGILACCRANGTCGCTWAPGAYCL